MALFWLSDEAWMAIEPHLPKNQPGARRVDDRRVISGILHVLKVGCRLCDCPTDYGPSTTVYNRFKCRLVSCRYCQAATATPVISAQTRKAWARLRRWSGAAHSIPTVPEVTPQSDR